VHYPCQRTLARPLSTPTYASASTASLRRWLRPPASTLTSRKRTIVGIGGFAAGRLTTPEGVAILITYLASDRTAKIAGASYLIDGGLIKAI
jgi:NAD(P)-dependent dehydrogenase (short-subunit alcohol dehydrogenase family)